MRPLMLHSDLRVGRRPGGMTSREIAKILGISHGTVQNIERRALAKMRVAAEKSGVGPEDLRDFLANGGQLDERPVNIIPGE